MCEERLAHKADDRMDGRRNSSNVSHGLRYARRWSYPKDVAVPPPRLPRALGAVARRLHHPAVLLDAHLMSLVCIHPVHQWADDPLVVLAHGDGCFDYRSGTHRPLRVVLRGALGLQSVCVWKDGVLVGEGSQPILSQPPLLLLPLPCGGAPPRSSQALRAAPGWCSWGARRPCRARASG